MCSMEVNVLNYYEILGVDPTSSQDDVKKAYRELVKKWHPDINKDNPFAEETFKKITEIYTVLSDPQLRQEYDNQINNNQEDAEKEEFEKLFQYIVDLLVHGNTKDDVFSYLISIGCSAESAQYLVLSAQNYIKEVSATLNYSDYTNTKPHVNNEANIISPWARYLAKMIDYWLFYWVFVLMIYMFNFQFFSNWDGYHFYFLVIAIGIIIESILISNFGTTPGKWLLGISIRNYCENKISFWQSLKRGLLVFTVGMGASIPFVNIVTLFVSYSQLKEQGFTYWDSLLMTKVAQKPIKIVQWVIAWSILSGLISLGSHVGSNAN